MNRNITNNRAIKIENIPTEIFNEILDQFQNDGWKKIYEYDLFDAWIDYGKVILEKDGQEIVFEWDNWFEGIIEGSADVVEKIIISGKNVGVSE